MELPADELVVLTDGESQITVSSPDLTVGGAAALELRFASGAVASVTAPVMSSEQSVYATLSPAATPSASPSGTPAGEPQAGAAAGTPGTSAPAATPTATP